MSRIRIFVSFDLDHDEDLCDLLSEQSSDPSLGFEVLGRSSARSANATPGREVRRRIAQADGVIVICGEHTGDSTRVSAELCIAQEEHTPYFLLWGRRERLCTKPLSAKRNEGMYSWTSEILRNQLVSARRASHGDPRARGAPATRRT